MPTYKERPMTVRLLTYTPNPLSVFYEVWNRTRDIRVLEPEDPRRRSEEIAVFRKLLWEFTQIPEAIKFTFWIEGVARSFYDQLTRHREPGWFTKSHRIHGVVGFSERGDYLTTEEIASKPKRLEIYERTMRIIDDAYQALVEDGCPMEDARGLLPLHLKSDLMWTLTLRDMTRVFRSRSCHLLQQEYWAFLAEPMRKLLEEIDPELGVIFQPPCLRGDGCVSPTEANMKIDEVVTRARLDIHPCRLYNELFLVDSDPSRARIVAGMVAAGEIRWAKSAEEVTKP